MVNNVIRLGQSNVLRLGQSRTFESGGLPPIILAGSGPKRKKRTRADKIVVGVAAGLTGISVGLGTAAAGNIPLAIPVGLATFTSTAQLLGALQTRPALAGEIASGSGGVFIAGLPERIADIRVGVEKSIEESRSLAAASSKRAKQEADRLRREAAASGRAREKSLRESISGIAESISESIAAIPPIVIPLGIGAAGVLAATPPIIRALKEPKTIEQQLPIVPTGSFEPLGPVRQPSPVIPVGPTEAKPTQIKNVFKPSIEVNFKKSKRFINQQINVR